MKVLLFGATGMVGRGMLLEAIDSDVVTEVVSIGRRTVDVEHPKLTQVVHEDFANFESLREAFAEVDACLWGLGISSAGMDEAQYTRITYDFTMAAARVLHEESPEARFCFVSGAGTDDSEKGRSMWARVKGRTENALRKVGFREVILFRPAMIRPQRGSKPRGVAFTVLYALLFPFFPLLRMAGQATSTIEIGRAMIAAARGEAPKVILDSSDINALAATA